MPQTRPRRTPLWFRIVGALFYLLFCGVFLVAGTGFGFLRSGALGVALINQFLHPTTPQERFSSDTVTLLIMGCDQDVTYHSQKILKAQARSDMMLVVKLDFRYKRMSGVSIPRDLLWQLDGYRKMKINAYHSLGGNDLARAAAEDVLGIKIDRAMSLDYEAFQEMVNLVGGVQVFVPKQMDYEDKAGKLFIHLKPGKQLLDGYQAMGFVRMRHSDSDFMRQERQRDFMLAFKDTVMQKPLLLNAVADKARAVLENALTMDELVTLGMFARTVSGDNVKIGMIPVLEGRSGTGYGYYLDLDTAKLPETLREYHLVEDQTTTVSGTP